MDKKGIESVGKSWNHHVIELSPELREERKAKGYKCGVRSAGKFCSDEVEFVVTFNYVTGSRGRVSDQQKDRCRLHAEKFAWKNKVPMPGQTEPPPRPKEPALTPRDLGKEFGLKVGDPVVWLHSGNNGWGYITPTPGRVVKFGNYRVKIAIPLQRGGEKEQWVSPERLKAKNEKEAEEA